VIEQIRLPRVVLAALIGARSPSPARRCRAVPQSARRPRPLGISAGAACGAVSVIVLGHHILPSLPSWAAPYLLSAAAFAGCLTATLLMLRLSMHDGHPVVATMLLAGVAINALASALTAFIIFLANDQQCATSRSGCSAASARPHGRRSPSSHPPCSPASCCCRSLRAP